MRLSEPLTEREIEVPENEPLVSKTDTDGRIIFANQSFVKISGFPIEELIGAPDNLVRHPHMPKEAFADLQATIEAGRSWEGLVKKRTKQGDFYWVRANVTPLVEDGRVAGYISIRCKPTRAQIVKAETAYRMMRDGAGGSLGLRDGQVIHRGLGPTLRTILASVTGRLAITGLVCALSILLVGWLGLQGMSLSNQSLQRVYEGSAVDTARITGVRAAMRSNVQLMTLLALEMRGNPALSVAKVAREIRKSSDMVETMLRDYRQADMSPEQAALVHELVGEQAAFVHDGLEPAIALAERGDATGLDEQLHKRVMPLFDTAAATNNKLVSIQVKAAATAFAEAVSVFQFRFWAALGVMFVGGATVMALGGVLLRTIKRPLRAIGDSFDAIVREDLTHDIEMGGAREFWQIIGHMRTLRAKMTYATAERNEAERQAQIERRKAVQAMADQVEQDAREAMERLAANTGDMAEQANGMAELTERVSQNAQSVTEAASTALANAQAVGSASQALSVSIQAIADQIRHVSEVARRAVGNGALAQERIQSLSTGALRIGDVVELIRSIAGQTNLLALNATIEAARAGEAGRGFNVVASEVKSLANETARSTEEISRQVQGIQASTGSTVAVVAELGQSIEEMAQIFSDIAAAIEEQAAATQAIARNVTESGAAAQVVTERITEVSGDAEESRQKADRIRTGSAAAALSIGDLRTSLMRSIRSATSDADRRMRMRSTVDEPCSIVWQGGECRGRLVDASPTGARLIASAQIPVGAGGLVVLDQGGGGATAGFVVRSIHTDGGLGVQYDQTAVSAAFTSVMQRLIGAVPARAA